MLKRICTWCKVTIGYKEGRDGEPHGICEFCATKLRKEIRQELESGESEGV